METYTHSGIKDYLQLLKKVMLSSKHKARANYKNYLKIKEIIKKKYDLDLKRLKILDIGCGQRYPYTFLLSKDNQVIGIDLDIILNKHDLRVYKAIISQNSFNRFLKTFLRFTFFDRQYFKELSKLNKSGKKKRQILMHMNAENLRFHDNSFDFIISVLSFEHFKNVEKCVKEISRVLKKGGKFYISIDVYSGFYGGHELNPKKPWNHLINKNFKPNVFLNKMRLDEYKSIFSKYFDKIEFVHEENQKIKELLTPELKNKLLNYSKIELTMKELIVLGEK